MGRLSLVLLAGVLVTQIVGNLIWVSQLRSRAEVDTRAAAVYLGHSASNTIRFFRSLPANYRPLIIQRFRDMGGTRFFVNIDSAKVPVHEIEADPLTEAAEAFGQDERTPELPSSGSHEVLTTARAFGAMRQRIQKYLEDRERLFISISHDLRTPITRLKLRSELLDDDALRGEFEEDLDELDMMVKGALQTVKDSDIHENPTEVRLDSMIHRMVRGARLSGHVVSYTDTGLTVRAKPLALKRAIGNLLDNALFYGERAELSVARENGWLVIRVRDHGPGVPEDALASLFEPRVRLVHGRERNEGGMGLGLGIARSIVQAHGGQLLLENHPEGGLQASIRLPAD